MLLVLDNFEHLLAGTGWVDEILHAAPQVKIVITSRTRLNRQAEQRFPIEGMAYPPLDGASSGDSPLDLNHYSAVQLFVQCARRVRPAFELTAANQRHVLEICHLLQGMPLGIVLAASWLESLSTEAISREIQQDLDFLATEMGDVPRRQRSLRAAFNHSWRLLSEREQLVFCQMSLFRGGFTRAAAQAVTGATLPELQALVNKSLLTLKADGRYEVHELLRQFAADKLSEVEELETAARERHSVYYCTLLQQHSDNWHNARQLEALAEVTREAGNVQPAWRWAVGQEMWRRLDEALDSWSWYHDWRGLRADGEAFYQAVCAGIEQWVTTRPADAAAGYRLWARAMAWYGEFTIDIQVAVQRFQQSLDLLARPELAGEDTRPIEAFTLLCLGDRLNSSNRQKARSCLEESLLLYEAMQDSWGIGKALRVLGILEWNMGDYALAQQRAEASLDIDQKRGDQEEEVNSLNLLGRIYLHLGQLAEAEQFRHQALDLCRQSGKRFQLAEEMAALAYTLFFQGRFDEGREWGQKSLHLCLEDGYLEHEGAVRLAIGLSHLHIGQYGQAQKELTRSLALAREINSRDLEAAVHCWMGYLALVNLDYDEAQAAFAEGYRFYQATQSDPFAFNALSGLGISTCCRGDLDQSRRHFRQLLTEGLRRKDFLYLLFALPGLVLYLARRGEVERATTIWTLAQCYPLVANSKWYEDVVGREMEALAASMPPEVAEAARERGRLLDLWETAGALLDELG
jgi:tetratricopeptide (TPR) repeat protein